MQQLETDLNFISSLPDNPAMATADLKREFDKAGNIIKNFINDTLEAEIGTDIANCLATAKAYTDSVVGAISLTASNISYDNTSSGLTADDVQEAIDELKTGLTSLSGTVSTLNSAVTALNSKIVKQEFTGTFSNMGDAEYTAYLTPNIPSGYKFLTANWDSFGSSTSAGYNDEPRQPVYNPYKAKITVHIGSAQVGHMRNHSYKIIAYYIKNS